MKSERGSVRQLRESREGLERSSRLKRDRPGRVDQKIREMKASTYILFSESAGRYYTGSCDDLRKRFRRHNSSVVPSTKYGVPWTLVWHQDLPTRSEARMLELKIKKRGAKRFLEDLSKQA